VFTNNYVQKVVCLTSNYVGSRQEVQKIGTRSLPFQMNHSGYHWQCMPKQLHESDAVVPLFRVIYGRRLDHANMYYLKDQLITSMWISWRHWSPFLGTIPL